MDTLTTEAPDDVQSSGPVPAMVLGSEAIDALIDRLHLEKYTGDLPQCPHITLYRRRGAGMNKELFIERRTDDGTTLYKYPEAFKTIQKLEIRREDPRTPSMDSLGAWTIDGRKAYMIGRVMASADDTVRVLFADPDSQVIRAVCSLGMGSAEYNALDAGKFMMIKTKGVETYDPSLKNKTNKKLPDLGTQMRCVPIRGENGYPDSKEGYARLRADYIKDFMRGRYKEAQLKCFKFTKTSMSYSDTVITADRAGINKALEIAETCRSEDFATLYTEVLKGAYGHRFNVNGVNVKVDRKESQGQAAVRYYVNNHRISAPDLFEVLNHALCFPGAPEVYEDYLVTVSKVSLKFHRAISKGLYFVMNSDYLDYNIQGEGHSGPEIRRPGGMDRSMGNRLCIKLKVNKVFGKKMNFEFAGRTRFVNEFDAFVRVAGNNLLKRDARLPAVAGGLPHHSLLTRLTAIDHDLTPESRFMTGMDRGTVNGFDDDGIMYSDTNLEIAERLYREFSSSFAADIDKEYRVRRRSHELLQQVMADTGARCVQDEKDAWVYKVTGVSGTRYTIDERSAAVFLDSGESKDHICIVKANNDVDGYDYISSLLIALSQDKYTARNIDTLQRHVNKDKAA